MNAAKGKCKTFSDEAPSQLFERAFEECVSGCVRHCACGRTLFDVHNHWDWQEGELENLGKLSDEKPDEYIPLDYSVGTMAVGGNHFVLGCPCNGARPYENFIISHARQIATFLNSRAADLKEEAEATSVNKSYATS